MSSDTASGTRRFTDATIEQGDALMEAVFYSFFDEPGESGDGVFFTLDIPSPPVGAYLSERMQPGGIISRATEVCGRLKLEMSVYDIDKTRTSIMLYYAEKARRALASKRGITFRLPGIEWQAPADVGSDDHTVQQTMFACTYERQFTAAELASMREESSNYE